MSFFAAIFSFTRNPVIKAMHTFSPFLLLPLLVSFVYTLFVLSLSFLPLHGSALSTGHVQSTTRPIWSGLFQMSFTLLSLISYLNRTYLNEVKSKIKPFLLNIPWSGFAFNLQNYIMSYRNL